MVLIDTSIWIRIFRDKEGSESRRIRQWLGDREVLLSRFNQLELLQGCRNENEWSLLSRYLDGQTFAEAIETTWQAAARIYFDLRRQGMTVRSPIDCCIAQIALENRLLLLHNDRDFVVISKIRPLQTKHWR